MESAAHHPAKQHKISKPSHIITPNNRNFIAANLSIAAVILIIASIYMLARFGAPAYFALTGKPFHLPGSPSVHAVAQPEFPKFKATASISRSNLVAGLPQTLTITATSDKSTTAFVHAWVETPKHKQAWRSPKIEKTNFQAGKPVTISYTFTLPSKYKPGLYKVSFLINSTDSYEDYYINENFAEFTLQ